MGALAIALAEMLEYGERYAAQVIKNAKVLGDALHGTVLALNVPTKVTPSLIRSY